MLGTKEAKTDKNALRYFFYSPSLFLPVYRATSVDFAYKNKYIKAEAFVENIPYGGLFDNSIQIFAPLKSMKSRVEIDFAIDTYRLRQITMQNNSDATLPLYADVGWSFTVFDLPNFGYEFYLNTGLVFPLTADDDNVFSMKPEHIKNMMHFNFGQKLRGGMGPTFSIEILFKSSNILFAQRKISYKIGKRLCQLRLRHRCQTGTFMATDFMLKFLRFLSNDCFCFQSV